MSVPLIQKLWIVEYRTRKRRNGKWSEWTPIERPGHVTAYASPVKLTIFEMYETRTVEFCRCNEQ